MKVAIAIWQGRVSPVFDASRSISITHIDEERKEREREVIDVNITNSTQRVSFLVEQKIEVLICGAVTALVAEMIEARGIRLIPFVSGEENEVLAAFIRGELPSPEYTLPGCGRRRRRRCGGRKQQE